MNSAFLRWGSIVMAAVMLAACGNNGSTGTQGPAGPAGPSGPPATGGSFVTIASNATPASDASAAAWAALAPRVTVTSVSINSAPVVNFTVTDGNGTPVKGLRNTSKSSTATLAGLTNLAFSLAKLVPGKDGSPSEWVSYIVTTAPTTTAASAPTRPGTDNTGTLVDHGDGTYTYTFWRDVTQIKSQVDAMSVSAPNNKADLGDLTYDKSRVHRLTIQLSGNAPGTGTNTPNAVEVAGYPGVPLIAPVDVIYDFVPATGQAQPAENSGRDIVATAKCVECHQVLGGIPGDDPESSGAGFHGGSRNEVRYCVVCHTEQRKYGRTEATINASTLTFTSANTYVVNGRTVGNLPNHIHHIHMGKLLAKKNYNYGGVLYNEVLFPQDLRNCTKCHDGSSTSTAQTAQGDNWKNAPSRRACGGCHDGIDFATGMGVTIADAAKGLTSTTSFNGFAHGGMSATDDSTCATSTCHTPGDIDVVHLPVTPPNLKSALHVAGGNANTNSAWIASNTSRLPKDAIKVTYDLKSVSRNTLKQPVMVFRILQNGARKDFNAFNPALPAASQEIWDGFMGSPSAYFVFAVPQDNIAAPADFNANASGYLRNIWNLTATGAGAGTLSAPDANGYYTVTLTGVQIPDSAVMLSGGLGYSYSVTSTLPLTQTNLADYPVAASPIGQANKIGGLIVIAPDAQKVADGYTGRRAIVEDAKCNKCHQELGTFTEDAFHAGQRNDGTTCAWCHRPNQTSSGWSADSAYYIHAIHAGNKRANDFTWHAAAVGVSFAEVRYPGVLRNCEGCHVRGTYDFSAIASTSALPNRLYRTVGAATYPANGQSIPAFKLNNANAALATACVADNPSTGTAVSDYSVSPYVTKSTAAAIANYGIGFTFNARPVAVGACKPDGTFYTLPAVDSVAAAGTTLVNSPVATVCFACHDSVLARTHMEINNGSIYAPRTAALGTQETCMVCHATGRIADIKVMHAK
ncbi:MAG: OmcA/MtrC family decaheme c-type cytochrome [Steroidobacteraceae bacterium]